VFFRGAAARSAVVLQDGLQVQVQGNISVYEARGQYQLIVQTVQPKGFGELQARFEALKRKLDSEGLFDPEKKRLLPPFPRHVGVVTSPTGAAIRDILNVWGRRAPWLQVSISPVRVQGEGSAQEIAEAIEAFEASPSDSRPDLLLIARGGGSIEDLWSFNEEVVARAMAACSIPILTGVGHEIDFTIADFVADRREPTPSAAAERATPDGETIHRHLGILCASLDSRIASRISSLRGAVEASRRELEAREPGRRLQSWTQSLDYLGERIEVAVASELESASARLLYLGRVWKSIRPERTLREQREAISRAYDRIEERVSDTLRDRRRGTEGIHALLQSLSPEATVGRGFSITYQEDGTPLTSVAGLNAGDRLRTRLADGEVESVVD
ncbi:MAG: exodeoxyribonuclease VII large subunit, partial [Verrucomicrobiota bacterium]